MKQSKVLYGLAVMFCLFPLVTACDYLPGFMVGDTDRGFVALQFSLAGVNVMDAASVKLELSSDDSSSEFVRSADIDTGSNSAYAFIPEVPAGWWYVDVTVYNSAGTEILTDSYGESMEVRTGEILTIEVIYDPALGEELTIDGTSDSTVPAAVSIDPDSLRVQQALYTDSEMDYNVQSITQISGAGGFQAASGFSFSFPDGTSVDWSASTNRSFIGEVAVYTDDTHFNCRRYSPRGDVGGRYGVLVTDIYGVGVSESLEMPYFDGGSTLAYWTNPPSDGSLDSANDVLIEWDPLDDALVQCIVVLVVDSGDLSNTYVEYYSPPLLGSDASVTIPAGELYSGSNYRLIILSFDQWIRDTSEFQSLTNLTPDVLTDEIFKRPDYDFEFLGLSYSNFSTY